MYNRQHTVCRAEPSARKYRRGAKTPPSVRLSCVCRRSSALLKPWRASSRFPALRRRVDVAAARDIRTHSASLITLTCVRVCAPGEGICLRRESEGRGLRRKFVGNACACAFITYRPFILFAHRRASSIHICTMACDMYQYMRYVCTTAEQGCVRSENVQENWGTQGMRLLKCCRSA